MKAYFSIFRVRLLIGLQYRAAALAGVATQFFWGFIYIMIFQAFYASIGTDSSFMGKAIPISFRQMVDYIWLQQSFLVFIMLWYRDTELFGLITNGNIAYELCRPFSLYNFWYSKLIAQRISGAILRCLPILLLAFALPKAYRLGLPDSLETLILFIITLLLGLLVVVAISMLIYISVFYTMSPAGSMLIIAALGEFFAGLVIPIPLMPLWLRNIAYVLPFRLSTDLPFRIYSGSIQHQEALWSIGVQLLWLTILIFIGKYFMKQALAKVTVQGG